MTSSFIYIFYTKKYIVLIRTVLIIAMLLVYLYELYLGLLYKEIYGNQIPDLIIKRRFRIYKYIYTPFVFPKSLLRFLKIRSLIFIFLVLIFSILLIFSLNDLFLREPKFIINNQGIKEYSHDILLWSDVEKIKKIRIGKSTSRYHYSITSKTSKREIIFESDDLYMKIIQDDQNNCDKQFAHEISEIIKSVHNY